MPVKIVDIDSLHVASEMQPRQGRVLIDTVEEYAEAIKSGAKFPPLVAFRVTDREYPHPAIVSGFHRIAAYRKAGVKWVEVEIREGTFREAWLAGWETNRTHGIRYTNSDKRHAAETALLLFPDESARSVADRLGLSNPFVSSVRSELIAAGKIVEPEQVRGSDGVQQTGKRKPTPAKSKPKESNIQTTPVLTVNTGVVQTSDNFDSEHDATESKETLSADPPQKPDDSDKQTDAPPTPASAPAAKAEPEPQPAEIDPADSFLESVEKLCRDMDVIAARIKAIKLNPLGYSIHIDSAADQVSAARKTLWQGRPSRKCPYCEVNGEIAPNCRACRGTGRVKQSVYDSGVDALGVRP